MLGLAFAGPYEDGVAALRAGDVAAAQSALGEAVAAEPDNADAWWELGWAHWAGADWTAAGTAWDRVAALDPSRDELEQWRGAAAAKIALAAVGGAEVDLPLVPVGPSISFAAVGDTMMGSELKKGAAGLSPDDGRAVFVDTAPRLRAADIAFLNLEGPLADGLPDKKCRPGSTSCYAFRTPTRYTAALVDAGIDVVSLANNHAMDLGGAGMTSTMEALDAVSIAHAGRYGDTALLEVGSTRVALIAAHSGSCCLNVNDTEEVAAAVRAADVDADIVVLSFHGGAEGPKSRHVPGKVEIAWGERRGDVKALARAAVDAGADLVLGHGPHVLRGMEVHRGRLIAYSLGNFSGFRQFGTRGGPGGRSVVLEVDLAANGVLRSARLVPLALDGQSIPHIDPDGAALGDIRDLSLADFGNTGVQVSPTGELSWTTHSNP
jgi:poly-gamma-glutamate capsule biosynthesis protein CapA/YwtB (metallophosphatase superfamily)